MDEWNFGGNPLVSAYILLEGGGQSKELRVRCREGFRKLLVRAGFKGRMPALQACGGRDFVYAAFCIAQAEKAGDDYVAMWIDSEEPMADIEAAWVHLAGVTTVTPWARPDDAADDQVLFMTTCMETWIVTDRKTIAAHYGANLKANALPPLPKIEDRTRHAIQDALVKATRECLNAYAKGKRSFEILGKLDPVELTKHLPSFRRVIEILKPRL